MLLDEHILDEESIDDNILNMASESRYQNNTAANNNQYKFRNKETSV